MSKPKSARERLASVRLISKAMVTGCGCDSCGALRRIYRLTTPARTRKHSGRKKRKK